jgi:hypothetical protein
VPAAVLTSPREEESFMAGVMIGVDGLQVASTEAGDAIGALMKSRKARDVEAAAKQLRKSIANAKDVCEALPRWSARIEHMIY